MPLFVSSNIMAGAIMSSRARNATNYPRQIYSRRTIFHHTIQYNTQWYQCINVLSKINFNLTASSTRHVTSMKRRS
ncbi:hypothetical protein DOY81_007502 [Sarcophaga bullata]|nr:hypothetical protein DOY81_007502 [Sarcophaga bullata]